ncbi:HTTM domain-containing protein [Aeromicrobium sp. Sec7.5]|uniref:HTTM domain-containing protein n=1 Tax=Aeromicrobium sp. Sec7.5 TaxID=3121276 RepID=UPI002FE46AA6
MRDTWWVLVDTVIRAREAAERWLFGGRHALVALGLCRILLGLSVVLTLVVNFSDRTLWVGNASVWAEPARDAVDFPELWLVRNATDAVVTVVYLVTTLAALALTAGWYTRAANVVTLVGFIAVVGQNPMVGSASDNAVRLALLWLVLTSSGDRCSVDARQRAARQEGAEVDHRGFDSDEVLPPWLGISLHNIGLLGLGVQTVLLYVTAGLDKIAREAWRSGEALYYTTQLPEFRPFGGLSDLVSASPVFLAFLTYVVLLTQLFFAPLMLTRVSRIVAVTVAIGANVFFAVVFGAVPAALAIIAVTLVVFPDDLLEERVDWLSEVTEPLRGRIEAVWFRLSDPFMDAADTFRSRRSERRERRAEASAQKAERKAAAKTAGRGARRAGADRESETVDAD